MRQVPGQAEQQRRRVRQRGHPVRDGRPGQRAQRHSQQVHQESVKAMKLLVTKKTIMTDLGVA